MWGENWYIGRESNRDFVSKNVRELDACSRPAYKNKKLHVKILKNLKACTLVNQFTVPILDEEKKLTYIFIFTLVSGASKGFMLFF